MQQVVGRLLVDVVGPKVVGVALRVGDVALVAAGGVGALRWVGSVRGAQRGCSAVVRGRRRIHAATAVTPILLADSCILPTPSTDGFHHQLLPCAPSTPPTFVILSQRE